MSEISEAVDDVAKNRHLYDSFKVLMDRNKRFEDEIKNRGGVDVPVSVEIPILMNFMLKRHSIITGFSKKDIVWHALMLYFREIAELKADFKDGKLPLASNDAATDSGTGHDR